MQIIFTRKGQVIEATASNINAVRKYKFTEAFTNVAQFQPT